MATTYYCNVGGRTLSQVSGGVRRDFLTDAIGSVTATINEHGKIENTYRYKPYGATLAKTGTGSDPRLGWQGANMVRISTGLPGLFTIGVYDFVDSLGQWTQKYMEAQAPSSPYAFFQGSPVKPVYGGEDIDWLLLGPPISWFWPNEHYVRVRSLHNKDTAISRISGTIRLPDNCLVNGNQGAWYNFYLAFAEDKDQGDTLVDCSVSIQCPPVNAGRAKGWVGSLRLYGEDEMTYGSCPGCGAGKYIDVSLEYSNNILSCKIGSAPAITRTVTDAWLRRALKRARGQMAMGSGNRFGLPEAHSIASWSNVMLNGSVWQRNNALPPQTQGRYAIDGINSPFLLEAHLFSPGSERCDCMSVEGSPPVPVEIHRSNWSSSKC